MVSEQTNCIALNSKDPVYTLYTDPTPGTLNTDYLTWPTVAASSIDVYEKNVIPNWNRSLLITSLKAAKFLGFILTLRRNWGNRIAQPYLRCALGKIPGSCISPDGLKIYVACDNFSGQTSGPTGSFNGGGTPPANAGRILEFFVHRIIIIYKTRFIK